MSMKKTALILSASFAIALPGAALAQSGSHTMPDHSTMPGKSHGESAGVAGTGTVNSVDAAAGKLNLTHEPIKAIGWPAMTMNFAVAEGVDLDALSKGDAVTFTLMRGADGIYMVESIQPK